MGTTASEALRPDSIFTDPAESMGLSIGLNTNDNGAEQVVIHRAFVSMKKSR